ncbi:hypothetical protein VV01_05115 [Luteipulveratus halotolerans]|uniref:Uncharacterized protein n=1 Tax=Luteipulveratus halotolerans TaxID=1631356 RepID=A0A0L6CGG1_9MICO|nr:hypothetical protein VV01_05115 [Luteipulveratus halotolerans]
MSEPRVRGRRLDVVPALVQMDERRENGCARAVLVRGHGDGEVVPPLPTGLDQAAERLLGALT